MSLIFMKIYGHILLWEGLQYHLTFSFILFPDSVKRTSHIVQIIRSPSDKVVIFLNSSASSEKSGSPSHK